MTPTTAALERLLGQIFDDCREGLLEEIGPVEFEKRCHDFIFHMTDWRDDLQRISHLYEQPEGCPEADASTFLIGSCTMSCPIYPRLAGCC